MIIELKEIKDNVIDGDLHFINGGDLWIGATDSQCDRIFIENLFVKGEIYFHPNEKNAPIITPRKEYRCYYTDKKIVVKNEVIVYIDDISKYKEEYE